MLPVTDGLLSVICTLPPTVFVSSSIRAAGSLLRIWTEPLMVFGVQGAA
jgi:hypothetical protein